MADLDQLFYDRTGMDKSRVEGQVADALAGSDDGELFMEYSLSESFVFDDGRLKAATYDAGQGFGLRTVAGEATGFAHASELSEAAIGRAASAIQAAKSGHSGQMDVGPIGTNARLYEEDNPILGAEFAAKIKVLEEINAYARALDPRVRQVTCSLTGSWTAVEILRADGRRVRDIRPLVRLGVNIMAADGTRQESGSFSGGGRVGYDTYLTPETWQTYTQEALRQALVNLSAIDAPAGEMSVVLGPGWPAVMLHEAVGHGLEGDFNRKKTSAFAGLMGQRVAAPGVTVIDDGTIANRRGSLTIDDEGTPTERTVLIEDGILKGYMQDRMNARLMGVKSTGNGRRQSHAHQPMPRMTNTIMLNGHHAPEEIISSVKRGLYAPNFGGGQVDITSGKFVFTCTEAYLIEDGKITAPVKGATLIGNGPDALTRISMIGNDMAMDSGIGVCGKGGQSVSVGLGQPTLRMDAITVGGTAG